MSENKNNNQTTYGRKIIPDKSVAKTNPLDSSHDYHDVDQMAKDLGVEFADDQELSMSDRLESRDKAR